MLYTMNDVYKQNKVNSDTYVDGKPVDVYYIKKEDSQGKWFCPKGELPSENNLKRFSGEPVNWGIRYQSVNALKESYGNERARTIHFAYVTRNGEDFTRVEGSSMEQCLVNAQHIIYQIPEHVIPFNSKNYDKVVLGRRVWWYDKPGMIVDYNGTDLITIQLDGSTVPMPNQIDIFSPQLSWF